MNPPVGSPAPPPPNAPAPTRGRAGYAGFRTTIKAVATGPRGSRDLTFDEAREAGAALLRGDVTPAQAGAFLIGMRVKSESVDELAGIAQALRDAATPLQAPDGPPILASAGAFDGVADAPPLSIAAAACTAASGARVVLVCGGRLGPKHGVTTLDVLDALGGPARPSTKQSEVMLARCGVAVVHAGEAIAGWEALAELREEVGLRGPVHSAEKLVDWFGARHFVVGHTHGSYSERLVGALGRLGAAQAIAVKGIEGSDVLRPGRPVAVALHGGALELPVELGTPLRGDADPALAAALLRRVLAGEERGTARRAVLMTSAVGLMAVGVAPSFMPALRRAEHSLESGLAAEVLESLAGDGA